MDRIRRVFHSEQPYEPIDGHRDGTAISEDGAADASEPEENPFSQVEYWTFLLMGVAMLWAWNMFLAAAPYFQYRFSSHQWILAHFQSAEISISTITNLGSMLILTKLQKNASYPYRIASSLCINIICFTLLAVSTLVTTSAELYFGFLMLMVFGASFATGLIQNGVFAYVAGFGRSEYTQAIMTGQAVAGVLPCLAQIGAVLAVPGRNQQSPNQAPTESPTSASAYFLTATAVSVIALLAFLYLLRRRRRTTLSRIIQPPATKSTTNDTSGGHITSPIINNPPSPSPEERKPEPISKPAIPLTRLLRLLPIFSAAVFLTFALTMIFPVFTIRIHSLNPHLLPSALFIPLAFLVWNVGDLLGRLLTLSPSLRLTHRPSLLLTLSLLRLISSSRSTSSATSAGPTEGRK
ncbi:hypothetical protein EPUS_01814 [Endocarpon pusillum Z07020]|uniref:Major facilitator superfamily (MFS) profile domain-containing protein n=1 Tax=Endocarpon pusillum (strain Z07020 / HMAS-L-300199) TaxID=1263415 RepID=U1HRW5_ENDPU|nr:uncharacterized protein EPUS_01814 [Endocarpon pusillum Z07020]ERF71899.1 hypothetical protein EPUS_01814 [Endocarpon pusillum Z07020]